MNDRKEISAAVDEMYAMISGPKGPRDWSRQARCFHPEARQIRTSIDSHGRPQMKIMSLDDYSHDTTPYFAENDFYEIEIGRRPAQMDRDDRSRAFCDCRANPARIDVVHASAPADGLRDLQRQRLACLRAARFRLRSRSFATTCSRSIPTRASARASCKAWPER